MSKKKHIDWSNLSTPELNLPQELAIRPIIPKVIQDGKEVVNPEALGLVVQLGQLAQLNRIRKQVEKERFEGITDSRTLEANDKLQVLNLIYDNPYVPWINAFIINDGPDTVYTAINNINKPNCWHEIRVDETRVLDQSSADERIGLLFYRCDAGEAASLRVEAHY